MSDNGSQPTSLKFMPATASLGIRQAFTADSNPKGNADTQRLIRTIKEELLWLREWATVEEVGQAVKEFAPRFNAEYLHSAIGYKTPNEFEKQWFGQNQKTLSAMA
jgi:putative transposase